MKFYRRDAEIEAWQVPQRFRWPSYRHNYENVPAWAWLAMELDPGLKTVLTPLPINTAVIAPRVWGEDGWQVFGHGDWFVRDTKGARTMSSDVFEQLFDTRVMQERSAVTGRAEPQTIEVKRDAYGYSIAGNGGLVKSALSDSPAGLQSQRSVMQEADQQKHEHAAQAKLAAEVATSFSFALLAMKNEGRAFRRHAWGDIWRMLVLAGKFTMEARVGGFRVYLEHAPTIEDQMASDWEEVR